MPPSTSDDGGPDPAPRAPRAPRAAGAAGAAGSPETSRAPERLLRVTRSCAIPLDELTWRFTTSGGPGGQHANRSATAVEVSFDAAGSGSLGPRQLARILDRIGPVVRARAADRRSQAQNRELALERLRARLAAALVVNPTRRATAPSAGARQRRLTDKHKRAQLKKQRGGEGTGPDD